MKGDISWKLGCRTFGFGESDEEKIKSPLEARVTDGEGRGHGYHYRQ